MDERKEFPAAANYTRTAVEYLLKSIAHRKRAEMPFTLEPHKLNTEDFLISIARLTKKAGGRNLVIPGFVQSQLKAMRKTVLNPLSHAHPNSITETEVRKAIEVGETLAAIEKEERDAGKADQELASVDPADVQRAKQVSENLKRYEDDIRSAIRLGEQLASIEQALPKLH